MELLFRAYDKADSLLGLLTEAAGKRVSVHYNGAGTGAFRINRHSSQFAWAAAGNYVRVYIDSTSNDPIFGFFIESGSDEVVSRDEQGGEEVQRGGRGTMAYLERAIIDNSSTFGRYADITWSWLNPTHGQIVKELIDDAQARSALPLLTYDFTNTIESGGGTWNIITGTYELPVGLDLLQMLARQQSAGLVASMSPDFVLSCSEVIGTDLSATIEFEAGVNISEEVTREVLASAAKSRILVQGSTKDGTPFFRWVADAGVEAALGDRREGFVSYQATADTGTIDRVGAQAINRLKRRFDGLSVLGVLTDTWAPFTDYQPGDSVKVNVAGVWTDLVAPITSIVLFDAENGEADCALEFEDIAFEPLQLRDRSANDPASGGGGGGGGGSGGSGGGGAGGGGGADGDGIEPCCPPPDPWTGGSDYELTPGSFFDYFSRAFSGTDWGAASSSGHTYDDGGGHMLPGVGALTHTAASGSGATADTTTVPEFTAVRFAIEIDFEYRPYDSADYPGDVNFDPGADLTGYAIVFQMPQTGGGGNNIAGGASASGAGLSPNTVYTMRWTVDIDAGTSRVQVAGSDITSAIGPNAPTAGITRKLIVLHNAANAPLTHVTRIQSYELGDAIGPTPGQMIYGEVAGTGNGVTTTFTTDWPYRAGGIVVRVNGINVTDSISSFTPATGSFTFATAPAAGSEITVDYAAA